MELNPRRRPARPLLRIAVAVLSGVAAMNAIQGYRAERQPPPLPSPAPRAEAPVPRLSKPTRVRTPDLKPAPSSMLVKREPGGAPAGILGVGEGSERAAREPEGRSEGLRPRLGAWKSRFSGFAREPRERAARPAAKRFVKLLDKQPIPADELYVPSGHRPELVPERPFWTEDRLLRVAGSALIALMGFFYVLTASGLFSSGDGS